MQLKITKKVIKQIHQHGEDAYPEEGAGFLFGGEDGSVREVSAYFPLTNAREDQARHNRYLITAGDMLAAENEAEVLGLDVLGVFHSHPDHPSLPSEFDRQWAMPWFSYLITTVENGRALESRSWRLTDDRTRFDEEVINLLSK